METNRYAPPKAAVADSVVPILKQRRIVTMLLFTLVTLGFYYPLWFLRRRAAFNHLDSSRKLPLWPFVVFFAYFVMNLVIGFISGLAPGTITGPNVAIVLVVLRLSVGIMMLIQCFRIKDILEDHLTVREDGTMPSIFVEQVRLSGLMTFFFSILYLQWVINRHHARFIPANQLPVVIGEVATVV